MANVIEVTQSDKICPGTGEADSIVATSYRSKVTVNAGAGDDTIIGNFDYSRINGEAGNDIINLTSGFRFTVNAGAGDDTIDTDYIDVIEYSFGDGDDIYRFDSCKVIHLTDSIIENITGNNKDVILTVGSGSLTLKNAANSYLHVKDIDGEKYYLFDGNHSLSVLNVDKTDFSATDGDDFIYNKYSANEVVKIEAGEGNDTIDNYSDKVSINAGAGNDSIYSRDGEYSTIFGGAGDDSIVGYFRGSRINGESGDDYIKINGYATVNGGAGNDTINGHPTLEYSSGDGDDVINLGYYGGDVNIVLTDTSLDNINANGEDLIFKVGSGSITLKDYNLGSIIHIKDPADDKYYIFDGYHTVSVLDVDKSNFIGTSDNDYIRNNYDNDVTITAGKGDDTLINDSYHNLVFKYNSGDGNDTLYGAYDDSSTIQLTNASITSVAINESDYDPYYFGDLKFYITGSGSITFKDVWKRSIINVQNSDGSLTNYFYDGQTVHSGVIYNYESNTKVTGKSDDYIYNNGSDATVDSGAGNDTIVNDSNAYDCSINSGSGNDIIFNYSGWQDADEEHHFITTINAGTGNDIIHINDDAYIQYASGDGSDTIYEGNDLDGKTYANHFIDLAAGTTISDLKFEDDHTILSLGTDSITLYHMVDYNYYSMPRFLQIREKNSDGSYNYTRYVNGKAFNDNLMISIKLSRQYYSQITGSNVGEYIEVYDEDVFAGGGDDYIYSLYGISENTIDAGDGDDTIRSHGVTDSTINGGSGNDHIQIQGGSHSDEYYDDDKDEYVYIPDGVANVSINGGEGNDLIEYQAASVRAIYYDEDENLVVDEYGYGKNVTIAGGKGNDTIRNTFYDDTITTTLIYDRLIQYAEGDGDDVIEDYNVGDTLSIACDWATELSGSNDIIIKMGTDSDNPTGSIKLLDALGKKININGTEYDTGSALDKVTLRNADKSPYTATSMVGTIDGSQRTKAISITGNSYANSIVGGSGKNTINGGAGNDTIIGGKAADIINGGADNDLIDGGAGNDKLSGDAGNDTLTGGKGNDTYTGGAGNDVFIFADGDGKDVIADYVAGEDVIKFTSGSITKAAGSKGNLTFTIGKGSIKLTGGVGKRIKVVDSSDNVIFDQSFGDKTLKVTNSDADTINTAIDTAVVTIDSTERTNAIELIGNTKSNVFNLGNGNSTVETGKGKDTVNIGESSKITITDYTAGQDKIKLNTELTAASLSGSDIILGAGNASITVKNAQGKKITVIDKDGGTSSQVYGEKVVTITNADGSAFKALTGVEVLDASKRSASKPITLTANDQGTTLIGGKGKDTLIGGAGADTFVYTKGGNVDLIKNYAADDVIKLGAKTSITDVVTSGDDFVFTIGGKKVTVEGGASTGVTILNDSNIKMVFTDNSRTSRSFDELIEDDNFNTDDMSAILNNDSNFITTDINFNETDNLTIKSSKHTSLVLPAESSRHPSPAEQ